MSLSDRLKAKVLTADRAWLGSRGAIGRYTSVFASQVNDDPQNLYVGASARIFKKDVVRGVIADLKIHALLAGIGGHVEIFIEYAVAKAIRARAVVVRAHGGGELVDLDEAAHELVACVNL